MGAWSVRSDCGRASPIRPRPPSIARASGRPCGGDPTSSLAGDGAGRDGHRTPLEERRRARGECRAGREDVVDEHDPWGTVGPGPDGHRRSFAEAEGARHVARSGRAIKVELRRRAPSPFEEVVPDRQAQRRAGGPGDERCLVVAAIADTIRGRRHRHQHVTARAGRGPATSHRRTEGRCEPSIARVLQAMQGPSRDPRERRAPLDLDERSGKLTRQPDRSACGRSKADIQSRCTVSAQRRAFPVAPCAQRGEGKVQSTTRRRRDGPSQRTSSPHVSRIASVPWPPVAWRSPATHRDASGR